MGKLILLFCVVLGGCQMASSIGNSSARQDREIALAEYAVLSGVAASAATAQPSMEHNDRYVRVLVPSEELGVSLVAHIDSEQASQSLVEFIRFKLGASLSVELSCYIAGSRLNERIRILEAIDIEEVRNKCVSEFVDLKAKFSVAFGDLDTDRVCSTKDEIAFRKSQLLQGMRDRESCDDDW